MKRLVQTLAVGYTNDLHSHFENMPKITTALRQMRERHQADSFLAIDCGDHMDRMRMETEGSEGLANIEIMNEAGYDVVTIGNNEGLTFLPEQLGCTYARHAKFSVLGTNVTELESGRIPEWMAPHTVIQKGDLSIGVIGVTVDFNAFYERLGWRITDPLTAVERVVSELRDQVDLLFVLSHLGLKRDQQMAREVAGIDCIFGGHTHHLLERPLVEAGTYICAAGQHGHYVGEIVFEYDTVTRTLRSGRGTLHAASDFADDPQTMRIIDRFRARSAHLLDKKVADLDEPLRIEWNKESAFGNFLADSLRRWTRAEIGLVNTGQIMDSLDAGTVTLAHLLRICPSPINPCRMQLAGAEIVQALEEALLPEYMQLPIRGFGFRGKVLGGLSLSGLEVVYDPLRPPYRKIVAILVNGMPLRKEASYEVGTIDMFTFGIGYTSLKNGRNIRYFMPEFIRDVLRIQLSDRERLHAAIIRSKRRRWRTSS